MVVFGEPAPCPAKFGSAPQRRHRIVRAPLQSRQLRLELKQASGAHAVVDHACQQGLELREAAPGRRSLTTLAQRHAADQ
jgi:hypothetical protein